MAELAKKVDDLQSRVLELSTGNPTPEGKIEIGRKRLSQRLEGRGNMDLNVLLNEHHNMQMELVNVISKTQGTISDRLRSLENLSVKKGKAVGPTSQSVFV